MSLYGFFFPSPLSTKISSRLFWQKLLNKVKLSNAQGKKGRSETVLSFLHARINILGSGKQ